MDPIISPSFLKQKARQLKKEQSLRQSQALDEAAKFLGYTNYKNYRNVLLAGNKRKESHLKSISSENDLLKKVELALSFIQNYKIPFNEQLDILKLFKQTEPVQSVCEKLNLMNNDIQSCLLKDFRTDEANKEIHWSRAYFIAKEIFISDLDYEVVGDMLCVDGDYVLKTESEFELDEGNPISKDQRFNDRELFGTFRVRIDRDKNITIEHSDIGEEVGGSFYSASFR